MPRHRRPARSQLARRVSITRARTAAGALVGLAAVTTLVPRTAAADELALEPDRAAALLVGAGLTTASFGVGFTLTATSSNGSVQNAGILIAQSGMSLAPLLAHGVAGEWKRGVFFTIPPVVAEVGMLLLVDHWGGQLVNHSSLGTQYLYSALFTASVISAAVGTIDAMGARDRAAATAARHTWITPLYERGGGGLAIGGLL